MAVTTFTDLQLVKDALGTHLGYSEWLQVTQDRINLFADATGDHQWIHVDVEKAKEGPFGAPIAHGYLTLALSNLFLPQIVEVQNISMGVNYGVDKIRFPNPVKVDQRIRGGAEITAVSDIPGGIQVTIKITIEIEGEAKPACIIESLTRYLA
ncbi:MaoC family dehydratase [Yinghuangia seranimata]|uniref:MaoC family dehydratase n=1 Tax=Yinghuangia seranimata TaxID=408067 RepID=UPI00248CAA3F|nr:MaoC family dehydratase [Yinghuangia seranimata]MDI2125333.1 MaoC family dehydratase [Yinghuangia seranimata]